MISAPSHSSRTFSSDSEIESFIIADDNLHNIPLSLEIEGECFMRSSKQANEYKHNIFNEFRSEFLESAFRARVFERHKSDLKGVVIFVLVFYHLVLGYFVVTSHFNQIFFNLPLVFFIWFTFYVVFYSEKGIQYTNVLFGSMVTCFHLLLLVQRTESLFETNEYPNPAYDSSLAVYTMGYVLSVPLIFFAQLKTTFVVSVLIPSLSFAIFSLNGINIIDSNREGEESSGFLLTIAFLILILRGLWLTDKVTRNEFVEDLRTKMRKRSLANRITDLRSNLKGVDDETKRYILENFEQRPKSSDFLRKPSSSKRTAATLPSTPTQSYDILSQEMEGSGHVLSFHHSESDILLQQQQLNPEVVARSFRGSTVEAAFTQLTASHTFHSSPHLPHGQSKPSIQALLNTNSYADLLPFPFKSKQLRRNVSHMEENIRSLLDSSRSDLDTELSASAMFSHHTSDNRLFPPTHHPVERSEVHGGNLAPFYFDSEPSSHSMNSGTSYGSASNQSTFNFTSEPMDSIGLKRKHCTLSPDLARGPGQPKRASLPHAHGDTSPRTHLVSSGSLPIKLSITQSELHETEFPSVYHLQGSSASTYGGENASTQQHNTEKEGGQHQPSLLQLGAASPSKDPYSLAQGEYYQKHVPDLLSSHPKIPLSESSSLAAVQDEVNASQPPPHHPSKATVNPHETSDDRDDLGPPAYSPAVFHPATDLMGPFPFLHLGWTPEELRHLHLLFSIQQHHANYCSAISISCQNTPLVPAPPQTAPSPSTTRNLSARAVKSATTSTVDGSPILQSSTSPPLPRNIQTNSRAIPTTMPAIGVISPSPPTGNNSPHPSVQVNGVMYDMFGKIPDTSRYHTSSPSAFPPPVGGFELYHDGGTEKSRNLDPSPVAHPTTRSGWADETVAPDHRVSSVMGAASSPAALREDASEPKRHKAAVDPGQQRHAAPPHPQLRPHRRAMSITLGQHERVLEKLRYIRAENLHSNVLATPSPRLTLPSHQIITPLPQNQAEGILLSSRATAESKHTQPSSPPPELSRVRGKGARGGDHHHKNALQNQHSGRSLSLANVFAQPRSTHVAPLYPFELPGPICNSLATDSLNTSLFDIAAKVLKLAEGRHSAAKRKKSGAEGKTRQKRGAEEQSNTHVNHAPPDAFHIVGEFFYCRNELRTLSVPAVAWRTMLAVFDREYFDNPYHNSTHAAEVALLFNRNLDVLISTFQLSFLPERRLAGTFAAFVHDIGHPGRNNAFLIRSEHVLSLLYNDRSCLENFHASRALTLLRSNHDLQSIATKNAENRKAFRNIVIELILATDMQNHFEFINEVRDKMHQRDEGFHPDQSDSDLLTAMVLAFKLADIGHVFKRLDLTVEWTRRVNEEFLLQGDEEHALGFQFSPFCNRETVNIPNGQIGFLEYVVKPMMILWTELTRDHMLEVAFTRNIKYWKSLQKQNVTLHSKAALSIEDPGAPFDDYMDACFSPTFPLSTPLSISLSVGPGSSHFPQSNNSPCMNSVGLTSTFSSTHSIQPPTPSTVLVKTKFGKKEKPGSKEAKPSTRHTGEKQQRVRGSSHTLFRKRGSKDRSSKGEKGAPPFPSALTLSKTHAAITPTSIGTPTPTSSGPLGSKGSVRAASSPQLTPHGTAYPLPYSPTTPPPYSSSPSGSEVLLRTVAATLAKTTERGRRCAEEGEGDGEEMAVLREERGKPVLAPRAPVSPTHRQSNRSPRPSPQTPTPASPLHTQNAGLPPSETLYAAGPGRKDLSLTNSTSLSHSLEMDGVIVGAGTESSHPPRCTRQRRIAKRNGDENLKSKLEAERPEPGSSSAVNRV